MMKSRLKLIVVTVTCITLLSGCLWAVELDRLKREIEEQVPGAVFKREFAITLGPVSLLFARMVTAFIPDAKEARTMLKEIRKVKVAVYEVRSLPRDADIEMPDKLTELLERKDWEMAARVSDRNENVWVLFREKENEIRDLYVVVLDRSELVMVKASGNMNRLVEKAVAADFDIRNDFGIEIH